MKLNFDYGLADNNGNVKSQAITTPTVGNVAGFTATQNYTYDSLNRLKSAVETIPNQTGWKQTFIYDRYGNRTFDTTNNNTTTLLAGCPVNVCNPSANVTNNKLVGANYDNVGNSTSDASNQSYVYDAENKMVQANGAGNQLLGNYYYDGDGKRVKKVVPNTGETTIFVYDAGGKMVAEYSTKLADTPQISYLTSDHLGSPRITMDANGQVISRRDFMPFGEEIQSGTGGRTTAQGYGGQDSIRQKFTGYERDTETDLDFAQARMYNKNHGRFTSPDPLLGSGLPLNPKTWNRYAYVLNNPLKLVDPTGLIAVLNHEMEHSLEPVEPARPPTVTVTFNRNADKFYNVSGATANDAIAAANKHFDGKFAGLTTTSINPTYSLKNNKLYNFSFPASKTKTVQVTGQIADISIAATATVNLPKWDGYDSASSEDKKTWDNFSSGLKDHEDGHVGIVQQDVEKLKTDVESALPGSQSVTFKSNGTNAQIDSEVKRRLNVQQVDSTIRNGISNSQKRQDNYDRVSNHTLSPQQLKDKGIVY